MNTLKVKANWEDSSDEELEETVVPCASANEAEPIAADAIIDTPFINRCDCFACISDSYEIEKYISETGFPPQCEKKLEADKPYDEDEGYNEDEVYDEEDEYDDYEEDEYDDACDMMDKKMGNYVKCR